MPIVVPQYWAKPTLSAASLHTNVSWTRGLQRAYIFHEGTGHTVQNFAHLNNYMALTTITNQWVEQAPAGSRKWALRLNDNPNGQTAYARELRGDVQPQAVTATDGWAFYMACQIDAAGLASGASLPGNVEGWLWFVQGDQEISVPTTRKIVWKDTSANAYPISDSASTGTLVSFLVNVDTGTTGAISYLNGTAQTEVRRRWGADSGAVTWLGTNLNAKANATRMNVVALYTWNRKLGADEIQEVFANPGLPFDGAAPPPSSPTGATSGSMVLPTLTSGVIGWGVTDSNGLTGFNIYQASGAPSAYTMIATAPTSSTLYTASPLSPATTYFLEVRANGAQTESPAAQTWSFSTLNLPTTSPTGATASIITPTQTTGVLGWAVASGPSGSLTGYNIYEANTVATNFVLIGTAPTSATSFTVTGLSPGTWYFFEIRATASGTETPATSQPVFQTAFAPDPLFSQTGAFMREIPISKLMRPFPDEPRGAPAHLLDWLGGER